MGRPALTVDCGQRRLRIDIAFDQHCPVRIGEVIGDEDHPGGGVADEVGTSGSVTSANSRSSPRISMSLVVRATPHSSSGCAGAQRQAAVQGG